MSVRRTQGGLVALLLAFAAAAWWSTAVRMEGMDAGPWTEPRPLGWFLGVWIVMMAAMMLPSATPTVSAYARLRRERTPVGSLLFVTGYLAVWSAVGVVAYALAAAGDSVAEDFFAWDRAGRWLAGVTLLLAAVYELTSLKGACLARCRAPLAFLLGSWRPGRRGSLLMGVAHGAWCAGCCWALMVSLFALGVMSIAWTALVAGLVALEKTLPWRRVATRAATATLTMLGLLLLVAPDAIPGLTLPAAGQMP